MPSANPNFEQQQQQQPTKERSSARLIIPSFSVMHVSYFKCWFWILLFLKSWVVVDSAETNVETVAEFNQALSDYAIISITSDLYINSSIQIFGIHSLTVIGNGFKIDGQGLHPGVLIKNSTVSISNLYITNGYSVQHRILIFNIT
jgi:hypothetical protein